MKQCRVLVLEEVTRHRELSSTRSRYTCCSNRWVCLFPQEDKNPRGVSAESRRNSTSDDSRNRLRRVRSVIQVNLYPTDQHRLNNLSTADTVHILEPQWNPSVEKQAIGRVVRLGQTRKVTIVQYIMEKTVENVRASTNQSPSSIPND